MVLVGVSVFACFLFGADVIREQKPTYLVRGEKSGSNTTAGLRRLLLFELLYTGGLS